MPVERRNEFESLPLDTVLWRYMDFTKFISMLVTNRLWLARADCLGDAFEGWMPAPRAEDYDGLLAEQLLEQDRKLFKNLPELRKSFYANCWHANKGESDAMWKLYVKGGEGIAIRTTVRDLKAALNDAAETLHLADVLYRDHKAKPRIGSTMPLACMTKRECFQHEREVRLFYIDERPEANSTNAIHPEGIAIKCNMSALIKTVHVAWSKPHWLKPIVKDILEKYNIQAEVEELDLTSEPHWDQTV